MQLLVLDSTVQMVPGIVELVQYSVDDIGPMVPLRGVLNGEGASATTAPKCTKVFDIEGANHLLLRRARRQAPNRTEAMPMFVLAARGDSRGGALCPARRKLLLHAY